MRCITFAVCPGSCCSWHLLLIGTRWRLLAEELLRVPHHLCAALSVSLERISDPVFDGGGLEGFESKVNAFL